MIYCISGLGADQRVFRYLDLGDHEITHVNWIDPKPEEKLTAYCSRLIEQIDTEEEVVLLGMSFGGICAQEIACQIDCKDVIIISSIKSFEEMDWRLKMVSQLKAHTWFPPRTLLKSNKLTAPYYFGTETAEEKKLLLQIIDDSDPQFLVWAINEVLNWQAPCKLHKILHIHGTKDRIFQKGLIRDYHPIEGAGHFMIMNRAKEVSKIIQNYLQG